MAKRGPHVAVDPFGELEAFAASIPTLTPESVTTTIRRRTSAWLFGDEGCAGDPHSTQFGNYATGPRGHHLLWTPGSHEGAELNADNPNMDSVSRFITNDVFIANCDQDRASQVSHFTSSARKSARNRTLTEKDLSYHVELQCTALKGSIKSFNRLVQTYTDMLNSQNKLNLQGLYDARLKVETSWAKVTDCFNKLGSYSVEHCHEYQVEFDRCSSQNHALLRDITDAIRQLTSGEDARSLRSNANANSLQGSSKVSSASRFSRSGSCRSHGSQRSAKSMVMEAAAKAAELEAKLKFIDEEERHKAALGKLSLMRDLEAERAKINAINAVESQSERGAEVAETLGKLSSVNVANLPQGGAGQKPDCVTHCDTAVSQAPQVPAYCPTNEFVGEATFGPHGVICPSSSASDKVRGVSITPAAIVTSPNPTWVPRKFGTSANEFAVSERDRSAPVPHPGSSLNHEAPVFVPQHDPVNQHSVNGAHTFSSHAIAPRSSSWADLGALGDLLSLSRLPVPEPGVFCGDPLEFPGWRNAFATLIERANVASLDKVYYLKRYLGGAARKCVEGFLLVPTVDSYDSAMALIEKRFGSGYVVAQAFKQKIENWSRIGPKDSQGLQDFSDFLSQCEVAARSNRSLRVLDDDVQNRIMLAKLPDWLVARWGRVVHDNLEGHNEYPDFRTFVAFLRKEADIACNPVTRLQPSKFATGSNGKTGDKGAKDRSDASVGKTLNTVKSKSS